MSKGRHGRMPGPPPGEGWLGGKHRDRGCLGFVVAVAALLSLPVGFVIGFAMWLGLI